MRHMEASTVRNETSGGVQTTRASIRDAAFTLRLPPWLFAVAMAGLAGIAPAAQDGETAHPVPFFPSASDVARQGFARVINHSPEAGEVYVDAYDDAGRHFGPLTLVVDASETIHFNSGDLEDGNADKGVDAGVGNGEGDWRLALTSDLDIEVLAYIRTTDGFLTSMHDVVGVVDGRYWVATFNPGSNQNQISRLRVVNTGDEAANVSVTGIDGKGESPGSAVTMSIPAGASQTFTASELESGSAAGLQGALGDGAGKWQLMVESDQDLSVMSLLSSPTGHLTNLSTAPDNEDDGMHSVPLFPSASDIHGRQGFVRVINRSDVVGEVTVQAYDDANWEYGPLTLAIGANETVHFNSDDLELGNTDKGLTGSTGSGEGDWCLELSSDLDIKVLSYIRTQDGFLTAIHDKAPSDGDRHRVAIFNPGSNEEQRSLMRLVNAGAEDATAEIAGIDGRGGSPGSTVRVSVPAGASKTLSAMALESGDEFMDGALGDGDGKWQLSVESEQSLIVMSLLSNPTGHLTNLSTTPREAMLDLERRSNLVVAAPTVSDASPPAGGSFTLSVTVTNAGDGESPATTLRYYRSTDATIGGSDPQVGTDAVGALPAAGTSEGSISLTAPDTAGAYYYGACVAGVADESDTTDNCSSSVKVVVEEPERPDLEVGTPTVSDNSPEAGATFTLSAKVTNAGDSGSAATTLRYYRSTNTTISTGDTQVGTDAVGALAAAGTSPESIPLTAPATEGTYYYGACVDAVSDESDTTDNCSSSVKVEVEEPERPDLEVGTPTVSDNSPETGATFTLSATVRNAGDGESAATTLRYYRATNATISTSDTKVGTDAVGALPAAGTSEESISLTAPDTAGTYYYGACVAAVSDESDTTDNCSSSVRVTVRDPVREDSPDLMFQAVAVGLGPSEEDEEEYFVRYVIVVLNVGDGASAASTLRYFRSTDATITASDTQVGTDTVPVLAASEFSHHSLEVNPSSPGTYYYGACVDAVEGESVTSNNCSMGLEMVVPGPAASVAVTPGEVTIAALGDTATLRARVLDAQGNEILGRAVSWSSVSPEVATVDAEGVVTAVANGRATVTASASGFSGSTTVIVDQHVVSVDIDPGEVELTSVGDTASLTLRAFDANGHEAPDGGDIESWAWRSADLNVATVNTPMDLTAEVEAVGAGTTTVTVTVDGGRLSGTTEVTVDVEEPKRPDLEVGTPTASDTSPETGATFTLSATVTNAGDGESSATTLRYYRSTDATITTSDTHVGTDAVGALSASGTSPESIGVTAPDTAGAYYYGACVDAVADESDTTDNCSSSVTVTVAAPEPHPDLIVDSFTITLGPTLETSPGALVHLNQRVANVGDAGSAATTVRYYRSTDATIMTSDTQVSTDAVPELAASSRFAEVHSERLPTAPGTYYYGACVDAVAGESNTANNCSRSVKVTVPEPQPDLVVAASVDDGNLNTDESFTLSATVRNAGDEQSAASMLRYYRSTDSTISSSDTQVGTDAVGALAAAASSAESIEQTAPSTAGTYYYGACVDAVADESDTTNNCSASVTIAVEEESSGQPDLRIVGVVAVTSLDGVRPGSLIQLSATVRNYGDANSDATTLRYYRSTDATISVSDTEGGTNEVSALAPSGQVSEGIDLTAPDTVGAYYYGACVDAVADESDTTDNCSGSVKVVVEEPERPDLEVGTPTVSDNNPETGATFTLSAKVTNAGDGGSAATTLRYYRSANATISTGDTQVGTDAVGALAAAGTSPESIPLTAPATEGTYYYGACVDAVSDESDTTDNCSSSVKVEVEEPKYPDLEVGTPTASDTSPETGASFTLSATVTNAGDGESAATTLRYYRSADATISSADTQVGTDAVRALAAAGTSAESVSVTAPATAGAYYYGACVDAVSGESDTTDNCSGSVQVDASEPPTKPDLTVTLSFTVPDGGIVAGRPFRVGARVANVGEAASDATTLRYYVSKDAPVRTSETEVGTDAVEGLASPGSTTKSVELTAPSTPGSYYYNACVDGVEGESDTANNCSFVSIGFTIRAPAPNLVVESPSVGDASPETGASFTLSATVKNAGETESAATTLRYYRSTTITSRTRRWERARWAWGCRGALGVGDEHGVDRTDRAVDGGSVLLQRVRGRGGGRVGHDEQLLGVGEGGRRGAGAAGERRGDRAAGVGGSRGYRDLLGPRREQRGRGDVRVHLLMDVQRHREGDRRRGRRGDGRCGGRGHDHRLGECDGFVRCAEFRYRGLELPVDALGVAQDGRGQARGQDRVFSEFAELRRGG